MNFLRKLFGHEARQPSPVTEQPAPQQYTPAIDFTKIFPRIKAVYDEVTPDPFPATAPPIKLALANSIVFQPLAPGLVTAYALDMQTGYQFIQNQELSSQVTIDTLHNRAIANLVQEIDGHTQVHPIQDGLLMLTNGGNHELCMLLLAPYWQHIAAVLNDTPCIAVPAKDLLFITGKNNQNGKHLMRRAIHKHFTEPGTRGLMVPHMYEWTGSQWLLLETVNIYGAAPETSSTDTPAPAVLDEAIINGRWVGNYTYGQGYSAAKTGKSVAFELILATDDNGFTGRCFDDPDTLPFDAPAKVRGFSDGNQVSFIKKYPYRWVMLPDNSIRIEEGGKPHEVHYFGTFSNGVFEGEWEIASSQRMQDGSRRYFSSKGTWTMQKG